MNILEKELKRNPSASVWEALESHGCKTKKQQFLDEAKEAMAQGRVLTLAQRRRLEEEKDGKREEEALKARFDEYIGYPELFFKEQIPETDTPLPWQLEEAVKVIKSDGLYALSVSRQNGKSKILEYVYLYFMFVLKKRIYHSAHRQSAGDVFFNRFDILITSNPNLDEMVYRRQRKDGSQVIRLVNGGSINFYSRTRAQGLGATFDILGIDEAQELTTEQYNTILPTVKTVKDARIILTGTPPTAISGGDVWFSLYRNQPEVFSIYGIKEFTKDIHNEELWKEGNPSYGYTIFKEALAREAASAIDLLDFNIQCLGLWYEKSQKKAFEERIWKAKQLTKEQFSERFPASPRNVYFAGVKSDRENKKVSLCVAFINSFGEFFIQGVDTRNLNQGLDWLEDWISTREGLLKVYVDGGVRSPLSRIKDSRIHIVTVPEFGSSTFELQQAYDMGKVFHGDQPALEQAFSVASKRPYGTSGAFGYTSLTGTLSINMVEAAALAVGAALSKPGYDPNRKVVSF